MSTAPAGTGSHPRRLVAAFLAGAVSVVGFGDWNLFPLPILAVGCLFFLWVRANAPRGAALLGLAFGAGLFLVGVSWVYVSLHDFGMMPAPLAATATLLFCLGLALIPAGVGYLQARLPVAPPLRLTLVIPALWTLGEWVRSWIFTGFPWLVLGYSQVDGPARRGCTDPRRARPLLPCRGRGRSDCDAGERRGTRADGGGRCARSHWGRPDGRCVPSSGRRQRASRSR